MRSAASFPVRRPPNVIPVRTERHVVSTVTYPSSTTISPPTLYLLNAAAITKPHAIEHLTADLEGYKVDIAIVTETHLKKKHADNFVDIPGYLMFRRDRVGRRGGGVAIYVNSQMPASVWTAPGDSSDFELLWILVSANVRDVVVGALYHPPKPKYDVTAFLSYIETCVDAVELAFPTASIILAGDFNSLSDDDVVARSTLCSIVDQPTRGMNKLDRIYVSEPSYTSVKVVTPTGKSDHQAVIAYSGKPLKTVNKTREQLTFRRRSPNQHALFLKHLASSDINTFDTNSGVQANFDAFYSTLYSLLNYFYPLRTTTVTSTDPHFITPAVKALLRRKNRLMRAGRLEEAGALANRVRHSIIRRNKLHLRHVNTRQCAKEAWTKVRQLTKSKGIPAVPDGLTAQVLNNHYAAISGDSNYNAPPAKLSVSFPCCYVTELEVFRMLSHLKPTAAGLDLIPAWFIRLGAPAFAAPLAELFNQSLSHGIVPQQWKQAWISPIPKVAYPALASDYRPISVTSVLSRTMERLVVRHYVYPALLRPATGLNFTDQFAFRPTGSTDAALITLFHTVLTLLSTQPFVRVFSLDFSKAFDSVRHSTLMEKMAKLDLPDDVYNWINDFFSGHSHCTKFQNSVSDLVNILASVIQGSAIGPASFVVTASDLQPLHPGNSIVKFADDTYIIVAASNSLTSTSELTNVQTWADKNNLKLNCSKSREIIFAGRRGRASAVTFPPPCMGISQVSTITALGVIVNDKLTAVDHVSSLLAKCSSSLYAMRVLREHGLPTRSLHDVFRATVIAKITYCAPAWSGLCSANDRARLDAFLRRSKRYGYCDPTTVPTIADLFNSADSTLFRKTINNDTHVLRSLFPENKAVTYSLRARTHNLTLSCKAPHVDSRSFITRMTYKDTY